MSQATADGRRRRVRRATLMLFAVATIIYVAFIAMSIHKAHA